MSSFSEACPRSKRPRFEVSLSHRFGCTLEGPRCPEKCGFCPWRNRWLNSAVDEVTLPTATGYGQSAAAQAASCLGIRQNCGREKLCGVHLHNTRGQGLANALMAVELGITTLDSSLGGIGGCPFAPGASGNIVTEDLVFMLESMGLSTGIDLAALIEVRELVSAALPEAELFGFTPDAGLPIGYRAA